MKEKIEGRPGRPHLSALRFRLYASGSTLPVVLFEVRLPHERLVHSPAR
jgi:hypothetical protein